MREIGGEFELSRADFNGILDVVATTPSPSVLSSFLQAEANGLLMATGRAALREILRDIRSHYRTFKRLKAYVPSYTCQAVLQPFIDEGFELLYYSVDWNAESGLRAHLDQDTSCDVFLAISYFGFSATQMDAEIAEFRQRGVVVVEDITHRLLSDAPGSTLADYSVASLRKWFAIPSGAIAIKRSGAFRAAQADFAPIEASQKLRAMAAKWKYIHVGGVDKNALLQQFAHCNRQITDDTESKAIDRVSELLLQAQDLESIRMRRRKNAEILLNGIHEVKGVAGIAPLVSRHDLRIDTPLFVPVHVSPSTRPLLVRHMIENAVYTPVHWPQPQTADQLSPTSNIYSESLSLVCDQRYSVEDMKRVLEVLKRYWANNDK